MTIDLKVRIGSLVPSCSMLIIQNVLKEFDRRYGITYRRLKHR